MTVTLWCFAKGIPETLTKIGSVLKANSLTNFVDFHLRRNQKIAGSCKTVIIDELEYTLAVFIFKQRTKIIRTDIELFCNFIQGERLGVVFIDVFFDFICFIKTVWKFFLRK